VSEAISKTKLPLVVWGERYVPYLLNVPGLGHNVRGEVFEVDTNALKEMDKFEGAPTYYHRAPIEVHLLEVCHSLESVLQYTGTDR